jgi:hypothetical protein
MIGPGVMQYEIAGKFGLGRQGVVRPPEDCSELLHSYTILSPLQIRWTGW